MRLLLMACLLAACGPDLGEPGAWQPLEIIDGPLAPEIAAPPAVRPVGGTLRVVSFNAEFGNDLDTIIADLRHTNLAAADVILLQEIEDYPAEAESRSARLASALGMGHVYAPARFTGRGGRHGLAILARVPLANPRLMVLPVPGHFPREVPHIALAAEVDTPGGPVTLICMHLSTRLSLAERVLQIRPAVLDAGARVIAGGDLNTNPYAWGLASVPVLPASAVADTDQGPPLDDYLRSIGYATPTAGVGPTNHTGPLRLRLDALYTRGLATRSAYVERKVGGSDHWPLVLDVNVGP